MVKKIKTTTDKSVNDNTQKAILYDSGMIEIISMYGRKKVYSYFVPLRAYTDYINKGGNIEYLKREALLKLLNNQGIISKGLFDECDPLHVRILDSQVYAIDALLL